MNIEELNSKWDEIKENIRIEYEVSDISYKTWIEPLKLGEIKDETVYINAPKGIGQPSISVIKKKFYVPLKISINETLGRSFDDQLEIMIVSDEEKKSENNEVYIDKKVKYEKSNLKPNYTFDTFVVGDDNRFAHASAFAVSENPGEMYNPLFIYGGVGLGKTHLLHAIGNYIMEHDPDSNILYVTSEQFTNEIIEAIRTGKKSGDPEKINEIRNKYRNIDVLLIDDIQFLIGKPQTQEEFFHTFNDLYDQGKQIVISSDKPPKDMDVLEERYISRFGWGLIADIQTPNFETRMAIMQKKVESFGYNIDNEVLSYIASNVQSNIRELEGSIKKVVALANLKKSVIDIDLAKEALKDIVSPNSPSKITPENIITVVCDHYRVTEDEIKSNKRNKEIVRPRKIVMYLCRKLTDATYNEIADALGGKDHSTIMYGEKTISDLINKDEDTKRNIETIINKIKSD